ncbi:MAG: acetyl-CoA carboxylase biotin carboxyl carrier protein, partial [Planctomycetes bacterium]|nr:acetyl-CoA carboxylase biotin carboxyl carrier protein [Planctomycetota bacterium]
APSSSPAPASAPAAAAAPTRSAEGVPFTSPMVGTFYRSPSPDAESFVEAGSKISEETTLCIIEAMKVMNEIKAEMRGTVVEVLVQNGEPVEFGQPLFLIRPG